jgi:hypothetical protein
MATRREYEPNDKYEVEADAMADKVIQNLSNTDYTTISNSSFKGGQGDIWYNLNVLNASRMKNFNPNKSP